MGAQFTIQGKHNTATVFTDQVDDVTIGQIMDLCNQPFTEGSDIRIMPDTHAGKGCVIGTTMTIQDKLVPNLVGVDLSCGMSVHIIKAHDIDFDKLDTIIRKYVPHGQNAHDPNNRHMLSSLVQPIEKRGFYAPVNIERAYDNVGTLGGGNHFIEINQIDNETIALVIHSGSRNVGAQVARYHQDRAYDELVNNTQERDELIQRLKREGKHTEIESALKALPKKYIRKEFAYLEGESFLQYVHDVKLADIYAEINRKAMAYTIMSRMDWTGIDAFDTVHNYIDFDNMILRKGAISAQKGERVIIPINMRDGSIIATGKGNPEWNFSGPHGAGRVLSRSKAKEQVDFQDFKSSMQDVWTTSVSESTLDESPMAYKTIESIVDNVHETLEVNQIIKPLYNFKSS